MVRDSFTRVTVLADGQELLEEIPAEDAVIPNFTERNLYLQLGRGTPPPGLHSRPSLAVVAVLAAYTTLSDELNAIPRYPHDCNTVDDVGQKLETSFANSLNELFKRRTFAQVVHTDGVTVSLLFTRPKPAEPPDELPRMGKQEGAVNPLAHLDADWLGCDPGKTNMATVAHEERYPSGAVESVWQRSLTAGHYYRQSGITQHAKVSKAWMAGIQPEHAVLSQVTNYTASLQRYREYVAMTLVTWPAMWAELSKPRWSNARFRLYRYRQSTVATFWADVLRQGQGNALSTAAQVFQVEGLPGFWKGNALNVLRTAPFKAINFCAFDSFHTLLTGLTRQDDNTARFTAGALAGTQQLGVTTGVTATLICFPLDVVRTRLLSRAHTSRYGSNPFVNLAGMLRDEGPGALYSGECMQRCCILQEVTS
ncbi:uncharacterized protein HaLaN_22140 [Haematococcus lacustris]|uniref:Uncharacterized protein n=1 Tax=Haematococcus lacustris TaxID=44745 RepID=A0A699ZQ13_HAELA|nr:uncharacterized protein HaLaN_22140 [Haematococcus lacustris]